MLHGRDSYRIEDIHTIIGLDNSSVTSFDHYTILVMNMIIEIFLLSYSLLF